VTCKKSLITHFLQVRNIFFVVVTAYLAKNDEKHISCRSPTKSSL